MSLDPHQYLRSISANDPSFTIPETNSLLRNVVDRLERQEQQLEAAERQGRLLLKIEIAGLAAALVAAGAAILALV